MLDSACRWIIVENAKSCVKHFKNLAFVRNAESQLVYGNIFPDYMEIYLSICRLYFLTIK